ncbi:MULTISPECIES: NAD(P)-dependent oxidoreductase [Micromonospora]|uniref:NAD(P)-dependent oxidoreductase n=1 Tax=Micromonospora TaxID=1873 RepID=UPI001AE267DB|nr:MULTISPECIES: NAD(P)-dependent oxidoreductase [unclassified Micromonospora]MBP1780672.1 3-hydroxyisobutyrate dehydrogenase-like beta-hydroxyacid dehydrogenase [Micromonospora sp. HB375]MDH6468896.1 3-hydroxyisobutyrate dehydrogenase [Micromonospora sp. H404/HB375]
MTPSAPAAGIVALLGAGVMNRAIAPHLRQVGWTLRLYNRRPESWLDAGATADEVRRSPAEAAAGADVVLSMVSDDGASRAVWQGPEGAVRTLRPGALAVEASTVSAHRVDEWAAAVGEAGAGAVDAPVTGSVPRATTGTLVAFVGGSDHDFARYESFSDCFTERRYRLGPVGAATRFKLAHNLFAAVVLAGFAEHLALVERLGLDPELVVEIMSSYGWGQGVASGYGPRMLRDEYKDVRCRLGLMAKDVAYAAELAHETGLKTPLTAAVRHGFAAAVAQGLGDLDMGAVRRVVGS